MLERRIPAADVLPDHDPAALEQRSESISWLAGALRAVAMYKQAGLTVGETLEDKILLTAKDVRDWLGQIIGAEDGLPLVEMEQLCRSGSGGVGIDGFMAKGE